MLLGDNFYGSGIHGDDRCTAPPRGTGRGGRRRVAREEIPRSNRPGSRQTVDQTLRSHTHNCIHTNGRSNTHAPPRCTGRAGEKEGGEGGEGVRDGRRGGSRERERERAGRAGRRGRCRAAPSRCTGRGRWGVISSSRAGREQKERESEGSRERRKVGESCARPSASCNRAAPSRCTGRGRCQ